MITAAGVDYGGAQVEIARDDTDLVLDHDAGRHPLTGGAAASVVSRERSVPRTSASASGWGPQVGVVALGDRTLGCAEPMVPGTAGAGLAEHEVFASAGSERTEHFRGVPMAARQRGHPPRAVVYGWCATQVRKL